MPAELGFGCMRLPLVNGEVDKTAFSKMVDLYLSSGFNYFDTAHGYLDGKSETAIRDCLSSVYPRESFVLADKLTNGYFKSEAGVRPFFESQLKACGVKYFDWYLMHSQTSVFYEKFKRLKCYDTVSSLKEEGKIKHIGISFHDRAEVLERILEEQPQIEAVQIQLNFLDWDDPLIQSRLCYEVCRKFNKKVFVMEPLKGGILAKEARAELGLKFAAEKEGVEYVLSGMNTASQVNENIEIFSQIKPLNDKEKEEIIQVVNRIRQTDIIQCTACKYCVSGCPKHIVIPELFACYNAKKKYNSFHYDFYYNLLGPSGRASSCIECGKCESVCPQHLPIRENLKFVTQAFEKSKN